jgi:hypothetical protein
MANLTPGRRRRCSCSTYRSCSPCLRLVRLSLLLLAGVIGVLLLALMFG